MNIAVFSDSLPPRVDGIAVAVRHLATGLLQAGHQVLLVGPAERGPGRTRAERRRSRATERPPPDRDQPAADLGAVVSGAESAALPSIPTFIDGYPFAFPRRGLVRAALERFEPDVLSIHTVGPAGLLGLSLARGHPARVLFTWHTDYAAYARVYRTSRVLAAGSYLSRVPDQPQTNDQPGTGHQPSAGLVPASLRRALHGVTAVCAPSSGAAEQARRFGVRRPVFLMPMDVVPEDLGVGTEPARAALALLPGAGETRYLLYVGRLSREKNLRLLLEAFTAGVPAPVLLVLVGPTNDPRTRAMLHLHAARRPGRVVVLGPLPRACLGEIYNRATAFVTPSASETQCLGVSEAIALGVPVLVVDPRLAEDRPAGAVQVVPASPGSLAAALRCLLESPRRDSAELQRSPVEGLALRFAAAAEAVGTGGRAFADQGITLHWDRGRWCSALFS